jgi:hypothetical protein
MILEFIARNVAWLGLRWIVPEVFEGPEGRREAVVLFPVSDEELRSWENQALQSSESFVSAYFRLLPPSISLYPGYSRRPKGNQ